MALLLFPPNAAAVDTLDARSGAGGADRPRRRDRAGRSLLLGEEGGGNGSPRGGARAHWGQEVARVRQTRRRRAARGAAVLAGGLLLLGACGTAGTDPAGTEAAPVEPVQVTAGEGWRLLGEGLTGEAYRTGVATTDDQLGALGRPAGSDAGLTAVVWEWGAAVWSAVADGAGSLVRLVGRVVVANLGRAERTPPGEPAACPDESTAPALVVAVARDVLPDGPSQVQ